jgi:hypothetical protein
MGNRSSSRSLTRPAIIPSPGRPCPGAAARAPVQSTGANTDVYCFVKIGSTIYGSAVQANNSLTRSQLPVALWARAYNSAAISVPNATITAITLDSERDDTDSIHSTSSNTSRLTCNTAGKYDIKGQIEYPANATGVRGIGIRLNGTTIINLAKVPAVSSTETISLPVATDYNLAVGDYVELVAYQTSGGALNANATANYSPEFSMIWSGK